MYPVLVFFKDLFIIYKYTEAVFRHPGRGCQITLYMVLIICGCWDLNSGPPEEQTVLLTTEPSSFPVVEIK